MPTINQENIPKHAPTEVEKNHAGKKYTEPIENTPTEVTPTEMSTVEITTAESFEMTPACRACASNRLCSREQIRETDRHTIEEFGISGDTLMEIAGGKAAAIIASRFQEGANGILFCGSGNNGGDALVSARYLADRYRHQVTVVLTKPEFTGTPGWKHQFDLLTKVRNTLPKDQIRVISWDDVLTDGYPHQPDHTKIPALSSFDYIVDGLTGTGLTTALRTPLDAIVQVVNESERPVFSLDIPSGLDADTGEVAGECVMATTTITFGAGKIGFYLELGPDYTGEVITVELPFPSHLMTTSAILADHTLLDSISTHTDSKRLDGDHQTEQNHQQKAQQARQLDHKQTHQRIPLAPTPPNAKRPAKRAEHKYAAGTVHIIAGSEGLTGAAVLAAQSAWDHGAGAVILYAPAYLLPVYEKLLPRIIKVVLRRGGSSGNDELHGSDVALSADVTLSGDAGDRWYKPSHLPVILEKIREKPGVIVLGPGVGRHPDTREFCRTMIAETAGTYPLILDADALYAVEPQILRTAYSSETSGNEESGNEASSSETSGNDTSTKGTSTRSAPCILTPHPGELRKALGLSFQNDHSRLQAVKMFAAENNCFLYSKGYPSIFANPNRMVWITGYDTREFARAGTGDQLAGAIAAILHQYQEPEDAVMKASIAMASVPQPTYIQSQPG